MERVVAPRHMIAVLLPLVVALQALVLPTTFRPCMAATRESVPSGDAHASALRVADEFLHAWAHRDADSGLERVSARLRATMDEGDLRQRIAGLSNPRHYAFEIGAGADVDSTRFRFPAVLYEWYANEPYAYRVDGGGESQSGTFLEIRRFS